MSVVSNNFCFSKRSMLKFDATLLAMTEGSFSFLKLRLFSSLSFFEIFESLSYLLTIALDKEMASVFLESKITSSQLASKKSLLSLNSVILTTLFPSTKILTVPSGSFNSCKISPRVP